MTRRTCTRPVGDCDRGSVAVWMITTALSMILLVGLAVDLGGQVHATARAQDIAAEAARAAGQHLHGGPAVRGHRASVDPAAALAAAQTYIRGAPGVTGTATITAGTRIVTTTHATYTTRFLSIIGIRNLTVTGHAEAQITRAVAGEPR